MTHRPYVHKPWKPGKKVDFVQSVSIGIALHTHDPGDVPASSAESYAHSLRPASLVPDGPYLCSTHEDCRAYPHIAFECARAARRVGDVLGLRAAAAEQFRRARRRGTRARQLNRDELVIAAGAWLDRLARTLGTRRIDRETDAAFRERCLASSIGSISVTPAAYLERIETTVTLSDD